MRDLLLDIGMRPSDVLFADAILIVDGLSDEIFYNGLSRILRVPLADRYIRTIASNGKNNGTYKIEFWTKVGQEAGLPVYVIADKDGEGEVDEVIGKGLITRANCLVLQSGALEDQYPWEALARALSNRFEVSVEEPIVPGNRVKDIRALLPQKIRRSKKWKVELAEEMVEVLAADVLAPDLIEVANFLRRLYSSMDV